MHNYILNLHRRRIKGMDAKENVNIEGCPFHGGATSNQSSGTQIRIGGQTL